MSWRRFVALLFGLSPQSRFLLAVATEDHGPRADVVLSDDASVDRFVASLGA
jgi:hypothetical protein